jgi:hypothetical protein
MNCNSKINPILMEETEKILDFKKNQSKKKTQVNLG